MWKFKGSCSSAPYVAIARPLISPLDLHRNSSQVSQARVLCINDRVAELKMAVVSSVLLRLCCFMDVKFSLYVRYCNL